MQLYKIELVRGQVHLEVSPAEWPKWLSRSRQLMVPPEADMRISCRMGDPELLHCIALRRNDGAGGMFVIHDATGPLFGASASSNLEYAAGLAYFGAMVTAPRNGVEIFEDAGDEDA